MRNQFCFKYLLSCFTVMGYAVHEPGLIWQISKIATINIIIGMKWGPIELYSGKEEMDRTATRHLEYLVKSLLFFKCLQYAFNIFGAQNMSVYNLFIAQ